ncbi:disease resistance protein RGA2-like [Spinacia oleracea]|uniref:Disease resistance protein RGA2-like n=1 Tax=Spinacia oleracea TaxID=3562 RepID=A0A9R0HVH9_SPIOL|nr:disease resistance protein RGA2-like [Spinacia oleracea]
MADSIVSDLVGRLLGYLGQSAAGKVASYFGGRDKLKELEHTMMMIQARLSDAERLCEGEDGALVKLWLKRLKNVLYQFEDLFEEVSFYDKDMELRSANSLTNAVCYPFSKLSLLKMNTRVTQDVEFVMKELEGITSDMHRFHLRGDSIQGQRSLNLMSSRETHSFVLEEEVIGREENKNEILEMLLKSDNIGNELSVIPIVGIGGLGKTTLAQLVYNNNSVQQHFELRCWACISEICSFEELVRKVYVSIVKHDCGQLSIEQLQSHIRETINGKKYLIVLDDVWDEDRERWLSLRRFFCGGKQGSKIIVTSRSKVVALNMGTAKPYELKGLSEEKSWVLFRSLAFRQGQEEKNPNLTSIGKEIVNKCANVPLAIRTVAGILYTKDTEEEWMHFMDSDLRLMEQKENNIMSTLKLSYDHLPSQLKQCFAYCALFPKDHEFDVQRLIWLWMSQGFVQPLGRNQSPYGVGHAYFMELLRRCFFQDIRRNWYGRITKCKIHDLMHDLALMVGDECVLVDRTVELINENVRHVYFKHGQHSLWKPPSRLLAAPRMRSHLLSTGIFEKGSTSSLNKTISSLMFLRALDLGEGFYKRLPNSIGELKHLRYLRVCVLSTSLPFGITRLQNLQTLDLRNSQNLIKMPRDFYKLSSLRNLQLRCCMQNVNGDIWIDSGGFVDMPRRFGQLASLETLDYFIVGKNNGLDALSRLNLVGGCQIYFKKRRQNMRAEAMLANLKEKKLTFLKLNWSFLHDIGAGEVIECLQPPCTLKAFHIQEWKGVGFPSWGIDEIPCLLPNLVSITIEGCIRCQYLPTFSQLPHLKMLDLLVLHALEYIEIGVESSSSSVGFSCSRATTYFPALERLHLRDLPKLKSWSTTESIGDNISSVTPGVSQVLNSLRELVLGRLPNAELLPRSFGCSTMLQQLNIRELPNLESLPEGIGNLSQLYKLCIGDCPKLIALPESFRNLTNLQQLHIRECPNLESLPEDIGNLSQLRKISIKDCPKLTAIPESFGNLTALQQLFIIECPELKRRCQKPNGEDWPLIQHVPEAFLFQR